jgi:hypothetical protein
MHDFITNRLYVQSMLTTGHLHKEATVQVTFSLGVNDSNHRRDLVVLRGIITAYVISHLGVLLLTDLVLVLAALFQKLTSKLGGFMRLS